METPKVERSLESAPSDYRESLNNLLRRHTPTELTTIIISSGVIVDGFHRGNNVEKGVAALVLSGAVLKHLGTVVMTGVRGNQLGVAEERLGVSNTNLELSDQTQYSQPEE